MMYRRFYFLISLVLLLCLAGIVSAAEIEWDNDDGDGDRLWSTPTNWDSDTLPTIVDDDTAIMDAKYTDYADGPIIQDGVDAECGWFEMGYKSMPQNDVVLTMTGGTLTAMGWVDIGGYQPGTYVFNMTGGDVEVVGWGEGTWEGLWLAFSNDADAYINVEGGNLDIFGGLWLGWWENSCGYFNMTGGTYNGHYVHVGSWEDGGGAGRMDLHGGSFHCKDFAMGEFSHVNISDGVMTCETDLTVANGWLFDPDVDVSIEGSGDGVRRDAPGYTATLPMLVAKGRVTAFDVNSGEIITDDTNYPDEAGLRAMVKIDYDGTNAGMTTVSAQAMDPNLAYNPVPYDYASGILGSEYPSLNLSWSPGAGASQHDVYFGTSEDSLEYKGRYSSPSYTLDGSAPAYEIGAYYYWRIDEVNASGVAEWPGEVWRFRASDHVVVDDFDSYADTDALTYVWEDGGYNGSWSEATLEKLVVRGGNALSFRYWNYYYPYYSEIEAAAADLEAGTNWRLGGLKALSIWFHGEFDNDANEQMYVALEDSSGPGSYTEIPYYGDMNDVKVEEWQNWNIDLDDFAGVNLEDIAKVYIGFGDGVSAGENVYSYVYFDDIRLYPTRCVPGVSHGYGDATGDCVIDGHDLSIISSDWLVHDYNTVGRPGALMGFDNPDTSWRPTGGRIGGALYFSGGGDPNLSYEDLDRVEISELNLWEPDSDGVTISAWIRPEDPMNDYSGIIFSRDGGTVAGLSISDKYMLEYHWDDMYWNFTTGLKAPENTWSFVALVVTKESAEIYLHDGSSLDSALNEDVHNIEPFDGITCIGEDNNGDPRHFKGLIDDVRIYKYALDQTQIGQLANLTGEPSPGPLVHYELDETSGTIASDSVNGVFYHPILSAGNVYDEEAVYHKSVNLRDYSALADNWLAEVLWP